jgi:ketosteroid isomerase-like protein
MDPDLLRAQRKVWEVWFAGDTATLRQLTPGLIAISSGDEAMSNQDREIRNSADFHANGGRLIELTFPEMQVQRFGEVAIVYSKYRLATVIGTDTMRQSGHATEVFVQHNGVWVNPGWHLDGGHQNAGN